jgi:hypothetical protein
LLGPLMDVMGSGIVSRSDDQNMYGHQRCFRVSRSISSFGGTLSLLASSKM